MIQLGRHDNISFNLEADRDDPDDKSDNDVQMDDVDLEEDISPIQIGLQQDADDDALAASGNDGTRDKLELKPVKEQSADSKQ